MTNGHVSTSPKAAKLSVHPKPSKQRQTQRRNKTETREQIRAMTNSRGSQSEKLATGGGRETAARKPHNKKFPGPHH